MQVEDFDACCCEGLDWRKGKNDQNQGMTVLDILILIKSFPADKKKMVQYCLFVITLLHFCTRIC